MSLVRLDTEELRARGAGWSEDGRTKIINTVDPATGIGVDIYIPLEALVQADLVSGKVVIRRMLPCKA